MFDAGKIIGGIVVFLVLVTSPVWCAALSDQAAAAPQLDVSMAGDACIESKEYMRTSHMTMLATWREEVVRSDLRQYVASDGKTYDKSLTDTCLSCHTNKTTFCDSCHLYSGVEPNCWNCHIVPQGGN